MDMMTYSRTYIGYSHQQIISYFFYIDNYVLKLSLLYKLTMGWSQQWFKLNQPLLKTWLGIQLDHVLNISFDWSEPLFEVNYVFTLMLHWSNPCIEFTLGLKSTFNWSQPWIELKHGLKLTLYWSQTSIVVTLGLKETKNWSQPYLKFHYRLKSTLLKSHF